MAGINREWHEQHRMPKNPTTGERIDWHIAHAANCDCRPIPRSLAPLIAARSKGRTASRPGRSRAKRAPA